MGERDRNYNETNERSEYSSGSKEFMIGAIIGGVIGAAAALFFAPKSGKEMRNNLNKQVLVLKDKTGQIRDSAMTKGNSLASAAKEKTVQLRDQAMTKGSELASVAKEKTITLTGTITQQSTNLLNKVKNMNTAQKDEATREKNVPETPSKTIIIDAPKSYGNWSDVDIQQKLEETKKAFDEMERKLNQ
ncbi:YtxH domain-containing protein [Bacillus methanolicus]|uniref:YtxH domain-containing protein n=1 Tax=Bacillus methanolicus TaxID=1471 RepID=UPI0023805571|nr:YtxH domain-containing protein [Bacillus methanolicus]MDE3839939.1 YtxH domain-containing protein [Bacillus methanolicus]